MWHGFVPGVGAGHVPGYRMAGPYDPPSGFATTPRSWCSIPTHGRSRDRSGSVRRSTPVPTRSSTRCTSRASPRPTRTSPNRCGVPTPGLRTPLGVLRPRRTGPDRRPRQAHRRTVGCGPVRQLRHRPVPPAVAGRERPLPRQHAALLAQPRGSHRRVRHSLRRLVGPLRRPRQAPHRVGQPDHRARRLHPGRPGLLRPQTQPGQRSEQRGRLRRQPVVELRRRGTDRRRGRARPARTPTTRAAHHPAALFRGAAAARRGRVGPHPAGRTPDHQPRPHLDSAKVIPPRALDPM